MKEKGITQEKLAEMIGVSGVTMSKKLNGKSEWTQVEINKVCEILELDPADIPVYFFTPKV